MAGRNPLGLGRDIAIDLGTAPHSGLDVQLCGDAHIGNFGFYASPERTLLFDLNDFDETAVAPFEWDLKRLAASVALSTVGGAGMWSLTVAIPAVQADFGITRADISN